MVRCRCYSPQCSFWGVEPAEGCCRTSLRQAESAWLLTAPITVLAWPTAVPLVHAPKGEVAWVIGLTGNIKKVFWQPSAAVVTSFTPTAISPVWWHCTRLLVSSGKQPVADCKATVTLSSASQAPRVLANPASPNIENRVLRADLRIGIPAAVYVYPGEAL